MTTIQEIKAKFGSSGAGVLNRYHEHLNMITAQREPGDGVYLDRLNDEQRMDLLREQKMQQASEITERAREDYRARVEAYHTALAKRTDELKSLLFEVQDAGALSRAALATDTELGPLLELASTAGNKELGKAAFVASEQRGLGNLMAAYFDKISPESRELYGEWTEIPPDEVLERQIDNIETVRPDPDPDRLMPRATVA
jgi:hypothetical protein